MADTKDVLRSGCRSSAMPCSGLPFGHLNLRANPFGELDPRERAATAVVEIDAFLDRLRGPGYAVQFMGDPGRGKTTHLLALLAHFPAGAYVHIPEEGTPGIPCGNPLFIDEIQRLSPRRRRRTFARADRQDVPLVLGTHLDVSDELTRAGFDARTVTVADGLTPERLCRMLNRRIEWVRRDAGAVPEITIGTARRMISRHGDNIRAMEGQLYELFQGLEEIQEM